MIIGTNFPKGVEVVVGTVIEKDGKILMTKSPKWSNKWTFPGGHVEPGENLLGAAKREAFEETGLKLDNGMVISSGELIDSKDFHRPAHFVYFDILFKIKSGEVTLDGQELTSYGWFSIDEALNLDLAESYEESLIKYRSFIKYNK